MSKTKKCSCKLKKPLIVLLVLAVLAFIGWLVYYFFFADDYEELDETLFKDDEEKAQDAEAPVEEAAEEAAEEAEAPADPAEETAAEAEA